MPTKPCAVCAYPVEIEEAKMEVHRAGEPSPDEKVSILAVCGSRRCQRLVREAIAEDGRFSS